MFLRVIPLLCAVFLFNSGTTFANSYHVGYSDLPQPMHGRLWYPIDKTIPEQPITNARIFTTLYGAKDAPPIDPSRRLPLLLLSHGSGSMVERLDWIADYFARRGWIVAGINHPGNTLDDNSATGFIRVWKRPKHISHLLDYLLNTSALAHRIDRSRIAAVGHSAGGTTVLLLAGVRMAKPLFQNPLPFCKPIPAAYDDEGCAEIKKMNYQQFSKKEIEGDYRDPRIHAFVAIDPGFAHSFPTQEPPFFAPIGFVFPSRLKDPAGEIYAQDFLRIFPDAPTWALPHSVHISFVSACSETGLQRQIPICAGDEGYREKIHEQTNHILWGFFKKALKP
ncbi:MAG: hypothetical protein HY465_06125 [Deltaproteobacteria bacterium]|nr:hypothetical protein [Deltaproteobacteria bacterium]